jgi:hypothetical protein
LQIFTAYNYPEDGDSRFDRKFYPFLPSHTGVKSFKTVTLILKFPPMDYIWVHTGPINA